MQFLSGNIKIDVMGKDTYTKRDNERRSLHMLAKSYSGWVTKLFA